MGISFNPLWKLEEEAVWVKRNVISVVIYLRSAERPVLKFSFRLSRKNEGTKEERKDVSEIPATL